MGWFLLEDSEEARACNIMKNTKKQAQSTNYTLKVWFFFPPVTSIVYVVSVLLSGNLDVAMNDTSLGTSRPSKTQHISHSCGHSCFSGWAALPCLAVVHFPFAACSGRCHLASRWMTWKRSSSFGFSVILQVQMLHSWLWKKLVACFVLSSNTQTKL